MKIGIISDTHFEVQRECRLPGWLYDAFNGVDMIVHAGDIEIHEALSLLQKIAPVYAVKGNCDSNMDLPQSISIEIGCGLLTVAHKAGHARLAIQPRTKVVVFGHTHLSSISQEGHLLMVNPGSLNLPRGGLRPSVAVITVDSNNISAELKHK